MNNDKTEPFKQEPEDFSDGVVARARKALEEAPEIIGPYRVIERLGAGGMGEVFRADQKAPIRRQVAIKLIKLGMDTKQVVARFEAERQALAVMDHPNIAKVFDGGTTADGRPYFVMEYVKGVPFTEYCDSVKLPLRERLNLFIPVCQAVQHAHQKGIVHRDLKPSNILICLYDGRPVPKVIDFGLAKALYQPLTDQTIYTKHGMMVGTPLYMSPEQAEQNNLDIDTRTDIYSLGVILYELLTGSTPLERDQLRTAAYNEVLRLIKEVEPPKPSTRLSGSASLPSVAAQRGIDPKQLSRSLSGDLDWIVMKALDKERSRRYDTAVGFAKDIERYLNDEAVEACPPSAGYRLKKVLNKHRGKVVAASLLLCALVIGIIGTSLGFYQAKVAETKANQSEAKTFAALEGVTKERDEKEKQRQIAEDAKQAEEQQRKIAEQQKTDLEHQAYRLGLQTAYNSLESGELDSARETLETLPERLRGWEWRWLMAETEPALATIRIPSNKKIIARSRNGAFIVLETEGKPNGPFEVVKSMDGSVVDVVHVPEVESVMGVCINIDARRCAILAVNDSDREHPRSTIYVWEREKQAITWSRASGKDVADYLFSTETGFAITDDGAHVSVNTCGKLFNQLNLQMNFHCWDGSRLLCINSVKPDVENWAISPCGETILLSAADGIHIRHTQSSIVTESVLPANYSAESAQFHRNDTVCLQDFKSSQWDLFDISNGNLIGKVHSGESGQFQSYAGGECGVCIIANQLQYFISSHNEVWTLGFIESESELCCDELNHCLYTIAHNAIRVYPLPSRLELEVLIELQGDISTSGKSLRTERGAGETKRPFQSSHAYTGPFEHRSLDSLMQTSISQERCIGISSDDSFGWFIRNENKLIKTNLNRSIDSAEIELPYKSGYFEQILTNEDFSKVAFFDFRVELIGARRKYQHHVFVFNILDKRVAWESTYDSEDVQIIHIEMKRLAILAGKRLELIDLESHQRSFPLGDTEIDAVAFTNNANEIATVTGNRVTIWDSEFSFQRSMVIPQKQTTSLHWTQHDDRIIAKSELSACICNPAREEFILKIACPESGTTSIPTTGESLIIDGRLRSTVSSRERWGKWSSTLKKEFHEAEIEKAKNIALKALSDLDTQTNRFDVIRAACINRILHDESTSPTSKFHAARMLYEVERVLNEEDLKKEVVFLSGDREVLLKYCRDREDNALCFFFGDVLEGFLNHWSPSYWDLNEVAWDIVKRHGCERFAYERALAIVIRANQEKPKSDAILNTIGVGYYRVDEYQNCIDMLKQSDLNASGNRIVSNRIFAAMAFFKLGDLEKANNLIDEVCRLSEGMPLGKDDQVFCEEALVLLGRKTEK